jgi:hypothetical protein
MADIQQFLKKIGVEIAGSSRGTESSALQTKERVEEEE